jgi:outer membrane protein TolC
MEQVRPLLNENPKDLDVRAEIAAYTENLRQVRVLLEGLQSELTARRDDLRAEWKRLQAASSWGGTLKQMR